MRTADITQHELDTLVAEIINSGEVKRMAEFIQHGTTTTLAHVIRVMRLSVKIARALPLHFDYPALIRGALLHDYYLYDWHDSTQAPDRWHGFTHPTHALKNAQRDFDLSARERDIIKHHMFPLVPIPPHSREAWVVTLADKIAALQETLASRLRTKEPRHV